MSGRSRSKSTQKSTRNQGGGSNPRKKKSRKKSQKLDPKAFWGDMDKLPTPDRYETEVPETLSVVHSLGRAPVPGALAEPYFAAVYDRAAGLARVVADAAGLDDLTPIDPLDAVADGEDADADADDGVDEDADADASGETD